MVLRSDSQSPHTYRVSQAIGLLEKRKKRICKKKMLIKMHFLFILLNIQMTNFESIKKIQERI